MKRIKLYLTLLFCCAGALITNAQGPFTPGNIVVFREGNKVDAFISTASQPVFLDEYTPAGTFVQSIALPTSSSGGNFALTVGGTSSIARLEGMINLSADGRYIVVGGYNTPYPGTRGSGQTATAAPRVIGLVDYNGAINVTTSLVSSELDFSVLRTTNSTDGNDLWAGLNTGNIRYVTKGSTGTGGVVIDTDTDPASINLNITNGQLYKSGATIAAVGSGTPTTSGQTVTSIPGFPVSGSVVAQYVFVDLDPGISGVDVLYIADLGLGLQKYSLVSGSWTLNGTIGGAADGYTGLTARVSGNTVSLFTSRKGANTTNIGGGELVKFTDAGGYNATFSSTITDWVVTNPTNAASFRGVALVPQAASANVSAKIFLQGAYNSGLGRHKDVTSGWAAILNASALNQPFNTAAFGNYNGGESVSSGFFTSTGATTDILDWVLVELHDATTPSTIVAREAAFVREDGQIVGLDGTSPVSFTGVTNGNYYLVVRHRNHLGVRSATTISVNGGSTATYNFTTAQSQAFQDGTITANPAMKDLGGGVFGLWGGNANSNTTVRFTGLNNDAAAILAALSANQAAVLSNQYNNADVNMDGTVRYTGLNNDAAVVLSVLGSNQAAVFTQHQ